MNSHTVRQIEANLHTHAQAVLDEVLEHAGVHPFDQVLRQAERQARSNDAFRVTSRSTCVITNLVADVTRAAYLLFVELASELNLTTDEQGILDHESHTKIAHRCAMQIRDI